VRRLPVDDHRNPTHGRHIGRWAAAFALFWTFLGMLFALQLFQATTADTSIPALRRAIAATTEIDTLLDRNYDDLRERADASAAGDTLNLRDYPIDIALSPAEVRTLSREELRTLLLQRSADVMYRDGTGTLRDDESGGGPGRFDAAGAVDRSMDLLRQRNHRVLGAVTVALASLSLVLAFMLAALSRGFGRPASVAGVALAGSLVLVLAGVTVRLYVNVASSDDTEYIQHELLEIGRTLSWIPIRNGIAFSLVAALLLLISVACARWFDQRPQHSA
jgi:hypothetical protein